MRLWELYDQAAINFPGPDILPSRVEGLERFNVGVPLQGIQLSFARSPEVCGVFIM